MKMLTVVLVSHSEINNDEETNDLREAAKGKEPSNQYPTKI